MGGLPAEMHGDYRSPDPSAAAWLHTAELKKGDY